MKLQSIFDTATANAIDTVTVLTTSNNHKPLIDLSTKLYEKGYSGIDLIQLIENHSNFNHLTDKKRYELLFAFNKVRKEFRNEKLLILFILKFLFLSIDISLENISCI